jgi:amino acid transporter
MNTPEFRRGRKPGDVRVRVDRPHTRYFRYVAPGVYTAKLAADAPTTPAGRAWAAARRTLFGRPLSTEQEIEERLPIWKALPVFSSDVMSSVAYATQASLYTLLGVGTIAFGWMLPISVAIVGVLALVTLSYRQTIRAYPNGGGSYIVAHANLGVLPGLVAAAALLTDYVLTVAVSVSSGVQALYSLFPPLLPLAVPLIILFILFVMAINLRGLRESGTIFASPTYLFLGSALLLIALGVLRTLLGSPPHVTDVVPAHVPAETFGLLLLMRAFADGCSAMTGTEAVANGVPAFRPPEWKNAQTTMAIMALLLGTMFLGVSFLSHVTGAVPAASGESVLSEIGRSVFGRGPMWYLLQLSTMGILVLAAQTSFADFPRLSSILARDGYMPRQFAFRGERLAFNEGIVALAAVSIALVVAFEGNVEALIPLYAIGVFTAFTLSQSGMVRHWFRERGPGWRTSAFFNGLGAVTTGIVVVIFVIAKFALGAWIVIVIVPILVLLMLFVHREYRLEAHELDVRPTATIRPPHRRQRVIVVAPAFTRAVVQAVKVARTTSTDVSIVHVAEDPEGGEAFRSRVERQMPGVPVVLIESPYRSLVRPFLRYLEVARAEDPDAVLVVLIPELESRHWWDSVLFNQNSRRIRAALVGRPDIVVLDVPYRREAAEPVASEAATTTD